jgi:SNF2 family DNA or RNA helicase
MFQPGGPPRYAHQTQGLMKLIQTRGKAALLFDPGLGKTATAIDYMCLLALKAPSGEARVLVVSPLAAVDTWVQQMSVFASPQVDYWAEALGGSIRQKAEALAARGGNPYHTGERRSLHQQRSLSRLIYAEHSNPEPHEGPDGLGREKPRLVVEVVNIDAFSSRRAVGSGTVADMMVDAVRRFAPDLVVMDESHRIKGAQSNASRLLARLVPIAPRRVILTGTVMPHSPLDVYGQWRFLDPHAFGLSNSDGSRRTATLGSFKGRFAVMGGYMGREIIRFTNLDAMQAIMSERATVARKEDALDLPPVTDVVVPVDLSPAEKDAYQSMKKNLAVMLADGTAATVPNRLAQMMRLRQITSGHLPDDNGVTRLIGDSKVRTICSIVHDNLAGERRVVVFCMFRHEIELLGEMLKDSRTEVVKITGATSSEDRMAIRKRFGSDDPARIVMVAQVRTMSLAVNELVTASHAVYGSLSQLRDDYVQSKDRLNRIGQTKPVTYWLAVAPGTVDSVILRAHQQREDLESAMLRHIMEGNE